MKNTLLFIAALMCCLSSFGQVVINELDSDTPGSDVKEFIELKSDTPFYSLDGYVLVMYNGSTTSTTGNKSYFAIDLDGVTTDANGLALIGNSGVAPIPDLTYTNGVMQNGADAIALYLGNAADFPSQTTATITNLISALAYSNNAEDCAPLRALLGLTLIYSENGNGNTQTESIQRKADGTYETKTPTPGALNDGTGIIFNGIAITVPAAEYTEGDLIPITFITQSPVTTALTFDFTLSNESFAPADYSGATTVTMPVGSSIFTINIQLIDDTLDEGDELIKINIGTIPAGYVKLNNNLEVRVIDNDYTTATWGTPINPTYGIVSSTAPSGYYASLEGKSGAVLKQAIQDIIANPATVHAQNYGDVTDILKQADQNPLNSNQVWLMYVEQGRAKYKFQTTSSNTGSWNREHIYAQSRGGFSDGTSSTADGINVWATTNADDLNAGHGDAHHIRAEDGPENSSRNNRDYGTTDYNGPAATLGSWHGDVARSLFYMACRYNALSLVNGNPADTTVGQLGDLATLLVWSHTDPSDDFEMNRNNVVFTWQNNRNPFIDYPDLADYIWGVHAGETWYSTLSTIDNSQLQVGIYPNPAKDQITVSGITEQGSIEIYSISGQQLYKANFSGQTSFKTGLATGMYVVKISSNNKSVIKKLLIQ